jgi:hypothetical protein
MAQRYIGDKVRQAERLRERARTCETFARVLTASLLERSVDEQGAIALLQRGPNCEAVRALSEATEVRSTLSSIDAHRETKHANRVAPAEITSLLTASSYRPEITEAIAHIQSRRWAPLGALCKEPIVQGRTPTYATAGRGYPCLKTRHVSGLFVNDDDPDLVTFECLEELARFRVAPETILMNRSGAGSVGRCAVYLSDRFPLTNEHLLHIRLEAAYDACFLALFLSSWWGERAIEQGITGSTGQLNLANEHVSRIPVPIVDQRVQAGIGALVRKAAACSSQARALVASAKQLVEQLVEGYIAESDLIAAQSALESSDRGADRAILRNLRAGGMADSAALIPDLDGLYALLDEPGHESVS